MEMESLSFKQKLDKLHQAVSQQNDLDMQLLTCLKNVEKSDLEGNFKKAKILIQHTTKVGNQFDLFNATLDNSFNQLQTLKKDIQSHAYFSGFAGHGSRNDKNILNESKLEQMAKTGDLACENIKLKKNLYLKL